MATKLDFDLAKKSATMAGQLLVLFRDSALNSGITSNTLGSMADRRSHDLLHDMILNVVPHDVIFSEEQDDFSTSIFSEIIPTNLDKEGRFLIPDTLKKFTHSQQISLMLLINVAQKKYLKSEIKYIDIVDYIMTNLKKLNFNSKFNSFNDTIRYINFIEKNHDK